MSAERPWVLTIGDRIVGSAETREAAQELLDPRHAALAFVTNQLTGERWLWRADRNQWLQFLRQRVTAPRARADIDG